MSNRRPVIHRPIIHRVAPLIALVALGALSSVARANITATTGAITERAHPTGTLNSNTVQSDTTAYIWFEQKVSLSSSLSMDHVGPGTVNSTGSANPGTVNPVLALSYIVHFDQDNTTGSNAVTLSNLTVTFERSIIGIWHSTGGLSGSDAQFSPSNLTYGSLTARRYELGTGSNRDRYRVSADGRTLTIIRTRTSGNGVDQLRVLVNPEPGTWALMGIGVAGLVALVARRRRHCTRACAT